MIKLEKAHIEEMRGIRKLDIDFDKKTFAISGPNGSGKSGVIDSIEFGLAGQIGRLTGRGTGGLSISEHGPHVDKTRFPDASFVELHVFLTGLGKSVKITRKINSPKRPLEEVLTADMDMNLALPCRVSVYSDHGKTKIGMIKPAAMLKALSDSPALARVAEEVEEAIIKMIDEAK